MNKRILFLALSIVLAATGIFLIVQGFKRMSMVNSGDYKENKAVVSRIEIDEATDQDDSDSYTVYVKVNAGGKEYEAVYDGGSSDMEVGEELTVLFNPEDPEMALQPGHKNTYIMFLLGAVGIIGAVVLVIRILQM